MSHEDKIAAEAGSSPVVIQPSADRTGSRAKRPLWKKVVQVFLPNEPVSKSTFLTIVVVQIVLFLVLWLNSPFAVLPKPQEVVEAFGRLWKTQGLAWELWASFKLNLHAIGITVVASLILSYLTVMPFFRSLAAAISKMRFLPLVGFSLVFTLMGADGYHVKLWLLVLGMTFFFVTSMASVVADIPKESYDHARTLRMSEWRSVWEVVIVGTADRAFEVMRQNAAIGWLMLTFVEGISRAEGGVGVMLLNANKYGKYDAIYALQIVVLIIALTQDYLIGLIRRLLCPYADLTLERQN